MRYFYTFDYNDSCNCHPEYREIECEGDTPEELGKHIARQMTYCNQLHQVKRLDYADITKREAITEEEALAIKAAIETELGPAAKAEEARKLAEEKRIKRDQINQEIMRMKQTLASLKGELNQEAIDKREAAIARKIKEAEACR